MNLLLKGNPGHGSRFIENTAAEKVQFLINKLLGYREEQKKKFEADPDSTLGDVTTVNLTTMSGGVQQNVVPNEFVIGFDIRITPTTNLKEFENMIRKWCDEHRYVTGCELAEAGLAELIDLSPLEWLCQ